jgi:hypothetical protein
LPRKADQKVRDKKPWIEPEVLLPGDEVLIKKDNSVVAKRSKIRWDLIRLLGPTDMLFRLLTRKATLIGFIEVAF